MVLLKRFQGAPRPRPVGLLLVACYLSRLVLVRLFEFAKDPPSEVGEGFAGLSDPAGGALVGHGPLFPFREFPHPGDQAGR